MQTAGLIKLSTIKLNEIFKLRQKLFIIEVTQRCNNNCMYCYNVWKCKPDYPKAEGTTEQIKEIILRIKKEASAKLVGLSGGEPMMREDIMDIVKYITEMRIYQNLITNGTILTKNKIKELVDSKVSMFEITLLSSKQEMHNKLTRNNSFDKVIDSIVNIKEYDGKVAVAFVATKPNIKDVKETVELAVAMDVDGIMFNRFNPGGEGLKYIDELLPSISELKTALETLDKIAEEYGIFISSQIPIPQCLIDMDKYSHIHHVFCPSGRKGSYYTVDSVGNVRVCNHTPTILGNIFTQPLREILKSDELKRFQQALPEFCQNCRYAKKCNGCCKASAEVCYGSIDMLDPFVKHNLQYCKTEK